jgi:DNA-binding XRE family transcriptional regulator
MTARRLFMSARRPASHTLAPMTTSATAAALVVFTRAEARRGPWSDQVARARAAVGRSIRYRRQTLQITGSALALLAGVNESELSKLERGKLARGIVLAQKVDATLSTIERERANAIFAARRAS